MGTGKPLRLVRGSRLSLGMLGMDAIFPSGLEDKKPRALRIARAALGLPGKKMPEERSNSTKAEPRKKVKQIRYF